MCLGYSDLGQHPAKAAEPSLQIRDLLFGRHIGGAASCGDDLVLVLNGRPEKYTGILRIMSM